MGQFRLHCVNNASLWRRDWLPSNSRWLRQPFCMLRSWEFQATLVLFQDFNLVANPLRWISAGGQAPWFTGLGFGWSTWGYMYVAPIDCSINVACMLIEQLLLGSGLIHMIFACLIKQCKRSLTVCGQCGECTQFLCITILSISKPLICL